MVWLDYDFDTIPGANAISLLVGLVGSAAPGLKVRLTGGDDGAVPGADDFNGQVADPDIVTEKATGLQALGEIDDIAIEAMPDAADLEPTEQLVAAQYLIAHCRGVPLPVRHHRRRPGLVGERHPGVPGQLRLDLRRHLPPLAGDPGPEPVGDPGRATPEALHPAFGDDGRHLRAHRRRTRGVFKAPANEVVYGLTQFESNINQGRDEVLNPEGINALRFFPDRGNRVWGARTLSSDPEWIYINVRRLFIYLEHSIDKATQWAVFEPNNESLWRNVGPVGQGLPRGAVARRRAARARPPTRRTSCVATARP